MFPTQQDNSWVSCTAEKVMGFMLAKGSMTFLHKFPALPESSISFLHCKNISWFSAKHEDFITFLHWKLGSRGYTDSKKVP